MIQVSDVSRAEFSKISKVKLLANVIAEKINDLSQLAKVLLNTPKATE